VLAVLVMVNYLSRDYCWRFHVSTHTRIELSPRTVGLLKSLTNRVTVTLYYEKDNALYSTVTDLLNEYRLVNPRISVLSVDYTRDLGAAAESQSPIQALLGHRQESGHLRLRGEIQSDGWQCARQVLPWSKTPTKSKSVISSAR